MKLEVGKFCRTRGGRKAGPLKKAYSGGFAGPVMPPDVGVREHVWRTDGTHGGDVIVNNSSLDLVAEWSEPTEERIVREELSDERVVEKFNELVKAGRVQCINRRYKATKVSIGTETRYQLKPAEPRCLVLPDSGLQTVLMEDGKTLEVGCSTITLTPALLSDFRAVLKGKTHFGSGLKVMRHGVRYSDRGLLSWADADALLAWLEESK